MNNQFKVTLTTNTKFNSKTQSSSLWSERCELKLNTGASDIVLHEDIAKMELFFDNVKERDMRRVVLMVKDKMNDIWPNDYVVSHGTMVYLD